MSHVEEGNLWITIMSNVNVIAVASLTEAAAVILAEGVEMTDDVLSAAREKGVAVYSSDMTVYELCIAIGAMKEQRS
jgi:predicted transcriptional regulator